MNDRQQESPVISVIIPCHNSAHAIGVQLTALTRQLDAPPFEVICVDNRSTDDLAAAIAPFHDQLDVRLVRAPALANPGYARNVGVGHAHGELLAFCDSDDHAGRWWVRDAVAALAETSIVNGGATPVADEQFAHGPDHLDALLGGTGEPAHVTIPAARVPYPILLGGSCAFRRDAFVALGGYDVAVPYGVEDNDLALRAQQAGHVLGRTSGMALAYRSRAIAAQTLRRAFSAGERHLLLAHRHDLFGRSPSLQPRWWLELPKTAAAGVGMIVSPRTRDWRGLGQRGAQAVGALVGQVRHGWLSRQPAPLLGIELEDADGNR